jgi:hypothetical protein
VPRCPSKFPCNWAWDRTRADAVGNP